MQFLTETFSPVDEILYSRAASGGGTEIVNLPILRAEVAGLPAELDGLLVASDLQGVAPLPSRGGETRLLGEVLAEYAVTMAERGVAPPPARMGVVLAGDLFSEPSARKRGATGEVGSVWEAFADEFAWVAGVAGNHDLLEGAAARRARRRDNVAILDGDSCEFDGLRIGGVSGIIGNKRKVNRKAPKRFIAALKGVLHGQPSIVVLHQGPPGVQGKQRGHALVGDALARSKVPLTVCGHVHWNEPLSLDRHRAVLNADARAVLLVHPTGEDDAAAG